MIGLFLGDTDFPEIVLNKIKKLKKNQKLKNKKLGKLLINNQSFHKLKISN